MNVGDYIGKGFGSLHQSTKLIDVTVLFIEVLSYEILLSVVNNRESKDTKLINLHGRDSLIPNPRVYFNVRHGLR